MGKQMSRTACRPSARHHHRNQRHKQGSVVNFNAGGGEGDGERASPSVAACAGTKPLPRQICADAEPCRALRFANQGCRILAAPAPKHKHAGNIRAKALSPPNSRLTGDSQGPQAGSCLAAGSLFGAHAPPAEQKIKPAAGPLAGEEGRDAQGENTARVQRRDIPRCISISEKKPGAAAKSLSQRYRVAVCFAASAASCP